MPLVSDFNRMDAMSRTAHLRDEINAKLENSTYAKLELWYGVNRYYLWHIVHNPDYQPPAKACAKLGIARLEPAPVCEIHGKVCYCDCTTQEIKPIRAPGPRRARRAVNLLDENSAALTIVTHMEWGRVERLIERLKELTKI
jgi:hypothetical protein